MSRASFERVQVVVEPVDIIAAFFWWGLRAAEKRLKRVQPRPAVCLGAVVRAHASE